MREIYLYKTFDFKIEWVQLAAPILLIETLNYIPNALYILNGTLYLKKKLLVPYFKFRTKIIFVTISPFVAATVVNSKR